MRDTLSLRSKRRRKFTCSFQILFASENTNTQHIAIKQHRQDWCQRNLKWHLLCRIIIHRTLHHHHFDFILLAAVHLWNVMIHIGSESSRRRLVRRLSNFPWLFVLIIDWNSCDNQTGVFGNQTVLIFVFFLCLGIGDLRGTWRENVQGVVFNSNVFCTLPANQSRSPFPDVSDGGWPAWDRPPIYEGHRSWHDWS